jgi:ankyrin repeat protein
MRSLVLSAVLIALISVPVAAQGQPGLAQAEQALMHAAFTGNLEAVQELVSKGISPNATDTEQHTPLMWAAFNGHTPVIRYLLEKGATLDAKDESGRSALMYASSGPYAETVELLLKKGAEVNLQGAPQPWCRSRHERQGW